MNKINFKSPRHQNLMNDFVERMKTTDMIGAEGVLTEVQSSEQYTNPGHEDHEVYLHMIPAALAWQEKLRDDLPLELNKQMGADVFDSEDKHMVDDIRKGEKYLQTLKDDSASDADIISARKSLVGAKTIHENYLQEVAEVTALNKKRDDLWATQATEKLAKNKKEFIDSKMKYPSRLTREDQQAQAEDDWGRLPEYVKAS